jgi:Bacterial aa3 type cytochrome c oxidase subunit IV
MAGDQDIKQNSATYESVMAMLKWGTVASALLAALVIILISG